MTSGKPSHLRTRFVFIDTEAMKHAQFDWKGKYLSKISELAKRGDIHLLTTSITSSEIRSNLRSGLSEALKALQKHRVTLAAIGLESSAEIVANEELAQLSLEQSYSQFLEKSNTTLIPLDVDIAALFDSYFSQTPPFSEKKRSEFPDAAVVIALQQWCKKNNQSVYVVSSDPDLISCCSSSGPLLHSPSLSDFISQAVVSQELHEKLEHNLVHDQWLGQLLWDEIKDLSVKIEGLRRHRDSIEEARASIADLEGIGIHHVSVLSQDGDRFECEIEFEAEIDFSIKLNLTGSTDDDGYAPTYPHGYRKAATVLLGAVIEVRYNPAESEDVEIDSVFVGSNEIVIEIEQVLDRSLRWHW